MPMTVAQFIAANKRTGNASSTASTTPTKIPIADWIQQAKNAPPPPPAPKQTFGTMFNGMVNKAGNFSEGVAKGELSTLQGAGNLVLSPLKKIFNDKSSTGLSDKTLNPEGTSQSIGKGAEQLAEFFVPGEAEENIINKGTKALPKISKFFADEAGNLTKVGKAAEYGLKGLVHGGTGGTISALQSGSAKTGAKVGGIIGLAEAPIALGGKLLGGIFKNLAAFSSGKGSEIINEIVNKPDAALKGMEGDTADSLKKSVTAVKKFAADTYDYAKKKYAENLEAVEKKYKNIASDMSIKKDVPAAERNIKGQFNNKSNVGMTTITPKKNTNIFQNADTKNMFNLSKSSFLSTMTKVFKDFGAEGSFSKGFDFSNSPTQESERVLKNAFKTMSNFNDISPTGLNNLARRIDGLAENTRVPEAKAALGQITQNIKKYLGDNIPEIKDMNAAYTKSLKFLEDLDTHLNTGLKGDIKKGMNTEQGMVETANKIAGLFGSNKELARKFISGIPGVSDMIAEQAGREVAGGVTKVGFGKDNVVARLMEAVIPPKFIGKLTANTSKYLPGILQKLSPAEQGAIKDIFQMVNQRGTDNPSGETSGDQTTQ